MVRRKIHASSNISKVKHRYRNTCTVVSQVFHRHIKMGWVYFFNRFTALCSTLGTSAIFEAFLSLFCMEHSLLTQ